MLKWGWASECLKALIHTNMSTFLWSNFVLPGFPPHNRYRPQWSWEGYLFTRVCQSFCSQGGCLGPHPGKSWGVWPGGCLPGWCLPWWVSALGVSTQGVSALGVSTQGVSALGDVCPGGCLGRHPPADTPNRQPLLQTVRILLECILVFPMNFIWNHWIFQTLEIIVADIDTQSYLIW